MNRNAGNQTLYLLYLLIIFLLVATCTDKIPQSSSKAQFAHKYTYQLPEKVDDGWEISSLNKEGIDSEKIVLLMEAILNETYKNIHGVLIIKNGKLVFEEYFHGYDCEKPHQIRSATKSIGSVLTGIAIDNGFILNVDEKIYPYFRSYEPESKWNERSKNVKLKHLLTMTSGYECDDHKSNFKCEKEMYKSNDWVEFALTLPIVSQPGEHWAYNSASLWLVGEMISKTSSMKIPDFAKRYLFDPLGITDFQWGFSPNGRAWLAGNAEMRPRDMAKFGYMVLNNGRWQDRQIVSKKMA